MIIRVWIDFRVKIRGSSRKKIFDRLGNINFKEIDVNMDEIVFVSMDILIECRLLIM